MRTDKPKKLTTIITGGLGNQLFKIMSGIRIAEDLKRDLTVDISHYESDKINDGKLNIRKFELEYFPNLGQFKYQRFKSNFYTKNFSIYYNRSRTIDLLYTCYISLIYALCQFCTPNHGYKIAFG
jgi:hypothetical protein